MNPILNILATRDGRNSESNNNVLMLKEVNYIK
jgi:hypothetical protein